MARVEKFYFQAWQQEQYYLHGRDFTPTPHTFTTPILPTSPIIVDAHCLLLPIMFALNSSPTLCVFNSAGHFRCCEHANHHIFCGQTYIVHSYFSIYLCGGQDIMAVFVAFS